MRGINFGKPPDESRRDRHPSTQKERCSLLGNFQTRSPALTSDGPFCAIEFRALS